MFGHASENFGIAIGFADNIIDACI
jgi:hypothetical protein